jgi:ferritin-like metal-binding protein YciE
MQREEIKELLKHEMGDMLFAEQRFLTATKQMAREAMEPGVKKRVEKHVAETEEQIQRLKQAFSKIGERAKAERCEGALGIKAEHDTFKKEEKPNKEMLAAFDFGSGLRVEHYEIAGYQSAIALCKVLGEKDCAELLQKSLREELDMAKFLEKNAQRTLKKMIKANGAATGTTRAKKPDGRSRSAAAKTATGTRKKSSSNGAVTTQDHQEIREWAESRGGIPTIVDQTGGLLRIDFVEGKGSGGREERLNETDWSRWFEIFDDRGLAFLHSTDPDSRFVKLVYPKNAKSAKSGKSAGGKKSKR